MSIQSIEMSDRFVGMPGTMQGGYIAGLAADGIDGPTRVRIRRPIHPGDILKRTQIPNGSEMYRENELVLIAQRSSMHIEPPVPTDISAAKAAMHSDLPFKSPYPNCIGCGHSDEGLGVRIRGLDDGKHVVAVWTPSAEWGTENGIVPRELVWTIFDCITSWAIFVDPPPSNDNGLVTGNIAAQFFEEVEVGTEYVFQAWRAHDTDRGIICGGALNTANGLTALADQELIRTDGWGMVIPEKPLF